MNELVSEKTLCRNATKDSLAHALVKIYNGANAADVIEKICDPRKLINNQSPV